MRPDQRREQVLDLIRRHEQVSVEVLAQETGASAETIRRDLTKLATRGFIRKFHGGGATPHSTTPGSDSEGSFQARMHLNTQQKRAIAKRAAALFSPHDTLFIDTGSTTVLFAEELAVLAGITVVTNSAFIAQVIARGSEASRVFLIGGEYRPDAAESLGALAVEQIHRFRCIHSVITVGAVEPAGVTDFDLNEAQIATAMVAQATSLTVLADSSKMNRNGLFTVCPLAEIDRLVTNANPPDEMTEALAAAGAELIIAPSSVANHHAGPERIKARNTSGHR